MLESFMSAPALSHVVAGNSCPALCWARGELIDDRAISNDVWAKLKLDSGGVEYVSAVYLEGDEFGDLPRSTECGG
jgi:hypothetical protein